MQQIPRAVLLPPPALPVARNGPWPVSGERDVGIEAARKFQRPPHGGPQAFLPLLDPRPEDTIEIKGKQFRFRPYGGRGAAAADVREAELRRETSSGAAAGPAGDDDAALEMLEGLGTDAGGRNSSTFVATLIAQERLREGLHNPRFAAASDAYRRAGGSPSAADNRPRVVSVAV